MHLLILALILFENMHLIFVVFSEHGFADNLNLYSVVSGMWASFLSLGLFIGPSVGGVLLDVAGYKLGSLYPFFTAILVVCQFNNH